ncbi:MAG TPA: extracellular solute-binding protein [Bryobacteraceae bacterium]|nr:extracellular solute-binding protein [Bryobacteraceae bacterium]
MNITFISKSHPLTLRGITWNHSRGFVPMAATAQRFSELNPQVEILWEKRSLQAFADAPLDKLADQYDLIVLDHPWAGFLASTGHTIPLDDCLPAEFLQDQSANSVGASHRSYHFGGKQWALAIDAATPVASWRPDLIAPNHLPRTWDNLLELANAGGVLIPGIPIDTLMNFYMLCSSLGEDVCQTRERVISRETGAKALSMLRALARRVVPDCFGYNPIAVYEQMTRTDRFVYCPFAYGYSNYSRPGYARRLLSFGDLVEIGKSGPLRSTLGGTGLAVTARCAARDAAIQYAAFVASPDTQSGIYVDTGGQPGHRRAWTDDHANTITRHYFRDTLPALDRAYLRPRYRGSMTFQDHAGEPIQTYLREGGSEQDVLRRLDEIYAASLRDAEEIGPA